MVEMTQAEAADRRLLGLLAVDGAADEGHFELERHGVLRSLTRP
jgi:hypothetical protein